VELGQSQISPRQTHVRLTLQRYFCCQQHGRHPRDSLNNAKTIVLLPYLCLGRQLVVGEGRLYDVPDGMTIQIAREGPCWKNPLMSVMHSTVDVDVKRNDVLLTIREGEAAPA
jgi:hypothetical protein